MNTALLAASVISIGGVPEPAGAKSREQLRRVLKKIGEAGLDALSAAFAGDDRDEAVEDRETEQAAGN